MAEQLRGSHSSVPACSLTGRLQSQVTSVDEEEMGSQAVTPGKGKAVVFCRKKGREQGASMYCSKDGG